MLSLVKSFVGMWNSASNLSKFTALTLGAATASLALKRACGPVLADTITKGAANLAGKVFSKTGVALAGAATVVGIGARYLYNNRSDNPHQDSSSDGQANLSSENQLALASTSLDDAEETEPMSIHKAVNNPVSVKQVFNPVLSQMSLHDLQSMENHMKIELDSRTKSARSTNASSSLVVYSDRSSNSVSQQLDRFANPIFSQLETQDLSKWLNFVRLEIQERKEQEANRGEIENLLNNDLRDAVRNSGYMTILNVLEKVNDLVKKEKNAKWVDDKIFTVVKNVILSSRNVNYVYDVTQLLKVFDGRIKAELMIAALVDEYEKSRNHRLFSEIMGWFKTDMSEKNSEMICLRTKFALAHLRDSIEYSYILNERLKYILESGPVFLLNDVNKMTLQIDGYAQLRDLFINQLPVWDYEILDVALKATPITAGLASDACQIFTSNLVEKYDHRRLVINYLKKHNEAGNKLLNSLKLI